jgi:hypothetical protein
VPLLSGLSILSVIRSHVRGTPAETLTIMAVPACQINLDRPTWSGAAVASGKLRSCGLLMFSDRQFLIDVFQKQQRVCPLVDVIG